MPLHLLGIARSQDLDALRSRDDNQPWVVHDDLAAAVVSPPPSSFRPLAHAALLAMIHRHVDILPARFGAVLPDEEAVRSLLDRRRQALLQDLDRLQGTGEMGLRIELSETAAPPDLVVARRDLPAAASPAQYLALRRRQYEWQDRVQQEAQRVTEDYVRAMRGFYRGWRQLTPGMPSLVRLAFLVHRACWDTFGKRLAVLRAERTGERCTLLGPWPPYSFVGAIGHPGIHSSGR